MKLYNTKNSVILFVIAALFAAGCLVSKKKPKKELAQAEKHIPFDAVIVPGIPFRNGKWDTVMKARVIWAYVLYKDGYVKNVIFSGAAVYSPYYESKIMGLYAEQLGIPKQHIFYDTLARHSTENVYYSYLLAKKLGFKSIALATDPFQSSLLKGFTRKRFATLIYHIPFVVDTLKKYNYLDPTIDPSTAAAQAFKSILETETFWQRFKGTMGGDIDWKQYPDGVVPKL